MPDGVLKLYEAGSEGPQWWADAPDPVRGLPSAGILDRCNASHTCPKIIEHFGAAEVWGLKLTPEWVGTTGRYRPAAAGQRAPLLHSEHAARRRPRRLQHHRRWRRRPVPAPDTARARCPTNPVPHTETVNALRVHFRNWVMKDVAPPASRYPTLKAGDLVDATTQAMGFPTIPGLPVDRADRPHQSRPRLRLRPRLQLRSTAPASRPRCRRASST